jgi:NTE family protein
VSGGSIFGAFLADRVAAWPDPGGVIPDWTRHIATPFRAVSRRNIRTIPLAERYLLPWNWLRERVDSDGLERAYRRHVTRRLLGQLPERPRFIFCASDVQFGVNWTFGAQGNKARIGDYQAGYAIRPDFPVARAVAASSCFPPVFAPLALGFSPRDLTDGRAERLAGEETDPQRQEQLRARRDDLVNDLRLSDGGVYDNLGLEPVWRNHQVLLVSDGGAPFDFAPDRRFLVTRAMRYYAIAGSQAAAVRKRWLIAMYETDPSVSGAYWGIGSARESYELPGGYSKALASEVIAAVRTDMDAFSDAEAAVLENHGYLLADAGIKRWVPALLQPDTPGLQLPHPDWSDNAATEPRIRQALADSPKRKLPLGRWR